MQELHPGLLWAPHTDLGSVRISESAGHRRFGPSLLPHKDILPGLLPRFICGICLGKLLVLADW